MGSYGDGNKYGFVERKSDISTKLILTVSQKGGWHEDPTHYYKFKADYDIMENGVFKKINSNTEWL